jgi:chromosomal replication initiation ATPase DnaA
MRHHMEIVAHIMRHFQITAMDILGSSRHKSIYQARTAAAYLLHKYADMSYPEIAATFGRITHSTFHTAAQRWPLLKESDRSALEEPYKAKPQLSGLLAAQAYRLWNETGSLTPKSQKRKAAA